MPAVSFSKTGTAPESTSWSWDSAAQNAILGDNKDNWAEYKKAHAWYNPDKDTVKAGFELPHHRMGDNGLEAVWHGVSAAMARLSQSDIPDDEMHATFDHLARHYAQWDKTPPEWDRFLADVRERRQQRERERQQRARATVLPFGMTRAAISITAARPSGTPNDDDMARINLLSRAPLDPAQLYVFPAEISNQSVDAYYTRMTPKSLAQFAADANRGVALCDSHNHYQLPIGRSFYGEVTIDPATGVQATHSLAYMLRGMRTPTGMNTDDIIRGIEGGINADVSIGFKPEAYWCNICHMDMLASWDCSHWPGQTYEIKDPDTGVVSNVLCIADVDASLAEYSLVYDGATPNAMVLKAQRMIDSGRGMTHEMVRQIRLVEDHCRVKLLDRWQGYGSGGDGQMRAGARRMDITAQAGQRASVTVDGEETEWETMRGSEFITRFTEQAKASASRAGKAVSQANLDRLAAMHDKLASGHDTMDEAMRELADFIDEMSASSNTSSGSNPGGQSPASDDAIPHTAAGDDGDGDDDAANGRTPPAASVAVRADGSHDAFTGTHSHSHPAFGSQGGDENHSHEHAHDGDANHDHAHSENAAPATVQGEQRHGVAMPADGRERTVVLAPAGLSHEQRAVFELGQRLQREAVDAALAAGVRAYGADFDAEGWKARLTSFGYDDVRAFEADWQDRAKRALSPLGRFTPNKRAAGGGSWSTEPTMQGGRQTQASDPNDPHRLTGAAATARGKQSVAASSSSREKDDPANYTVGKRRSR